MKAKLFEFITPEIMLEHKAELYGDSSGFNKIKYDGRESVLTNEVKPLFFESFEMLGRKKRTMAYIKVGDNFLNISPSDFKPQIVGQLTNEQINAIKEWDAIKALNSYAGNKGVMSGWMGKILMLVAIAAFLYGGYMLIQYITGGAIHIPKLI